MSMTIHSQFDNIVGQEEAKRKLSFYAAAADANGGEVPPILLVGPKGVGKTMFAKAFGKAVSDSKGNPRRVVTINSSSISSLTAFFDTVYPQIKKLQECTVLFDESHNLRKEIQTMFLTTINPEKGTRRHFNWRGVDYEFDLREWAFVFATTDPQSMLKPLKDRLTPVALRDYNIEELGLIMQLHSPSISFAPEVIPEVASTLKGNGRSAVLRAKEVVSYAIINQKTDFDVADWRKLKHELDIKKLGLTESEVKILDILFKRGPSTLATIAAATGESRASIQHEYEPTLVRLGLMKIDGKRLITPKGIDILENL